MGEFMTMYPKDLSDKELIYELHIRDIHSKSDARSDKLKTLKRAIQKNLPIGEDYEFCLTKESTEIEESLEEVDSHIKHLGDTVISKIGTQFVYVQSRLVHISSRVERVLRRDSSPGAKQSVAQWRAKILQLESDILEKTETVTERTRCPDTSISYPPRLSLFNMSLPASSSSKSVPVYKWGARFDGRTDLLAFLEKIHDLMIARCVSEDEVFNSAYDLFEGPALTWYRSIRDNVHNWEELQSLLKSSFLPSDNDDALWEEIRNKKQLRNESVVMFIASMSNLFGRLSRVPDEKTKLRTIMKNLLPYYISALALEDIDSIEKLLNLTKRIDEAYILKKQNLPVKAHVNSLATAGSQLGPKVNSSSRGTSNTICWNCRQKGHVHQTCKQQRKKFCYRCGEMNVVVKTCPKCSPSTSQAGNA